MMMMMKMNSFNNDYNEEEDELGFNLVIDHVESLMRPRKLMMVMVMMIMIMMMI